MIPHEKQARRTKLWESTVTFFDDPVKYTRSVGDYWFISPFRQAYNKEAYLPIVLVALFTQAWISIGISALLLCFAAFTVQSVAKFGWDAVNCLVSELCNVSLCSTTSPFDSADAPVYPYSGVNP